MNNNDMRYIKTDNAIKQSFVDCVNECGFEKTTITMICEKAFVGRKTFYLHYFDKYDLLDNFFETFKASLSESMDTHLAKNIRNKDVLFLTEQYINAIFVNREIFLLLIKCSKEKTENIIFEVIMKETIKKMVTNYEKFLNDSKNQLRFSYTFSAMVSFTEYWLKHSDKISKEEAITELFKLSEQPTLLLYKYF